MVAITISAKWSGPLDHFTLTMTAFRVTSSLIGKIGMEVLLNPRRKHVATIGMAVSESHQGKGAGNRMLEAVLNLANDWIAVSRIELEVYIDNEAAIRLYKKHGFLIEGTAKKHAYRNGEYADVHLMA
jgi:putative acetyltransferase